MKTTVKPFTKVVAIPGGDNMLGFGASSIPLTDTAGQTLECNWVVCKPLTHTAGNNIYLLGASSCVFPTEAGGEGVILHDISGGLSSFVGQAGSLDLRLDEGTEIFLTDARRITSVEIGHNVTGSVIFFVLTYGYRRPYNPIRASGRGDGN